MSIIYKGLFEVLSKKNISISEMSKDLKISSATHREDRAPEKYRRAGSFQRQPFSGC